MGCRSDVAETLWVSVVALRSIKNTKVQTLPDEFSALVKRFRLANDIFRLLKNPLLDSF